MKSNSRIYLMDDGNEYSVARLVDLAKERYGNILSNGTLWYRLNTLGTRSLDSALKPPTPNGYRPEVDREDQERLQEELEQRMFFDPHGHWALINKYV